MSLIILLDSGPLGLVTNPKKSQESLACKDWLRSLVTAARLIPLTSEALLKAAQRWAMVYAGGAGPDYR